MDDMDRLKKLRLDYVCRQDPPATRINFYVSGAGGIGKGLFSEALARSLYPDLQEDDLYFWVGAKGVPFEGYDGQPIIIWDDRRAVDLICEFGGREKVFNIFDSHPKKMRQQVKYASVNLPNAVNIVNGIEDYEDFLDGLAGDYEDSRGHWHRAEDLNQSYRRFPFIINVHENDFDMLLNRGFFDDSREYQAYYEYKGIKANFPKIIAACKGNARIADKVQAQAVQIVVDKYREVADRDHGEVDEAAILAEFWDVGKPLPEVVQMTLEFVRRQESDGGSVVCKPDFDVDAYFYRLFKILKNDESNPDLVVYFHVLHDCVERLRRLKENVAKAS